MHAVLNFIRNVVALLAIALAGLYLLAFIYLFMQQRNFLFARGRNPQAIGGTYHAVHVTEPDGMQILAWYAPPRRQAPTIVFFYGNAGTVSDFADVGKQFHAEGYGILLASYRGYDGNPGAPSEAGLMADARATLDWLQPHSHKRPILWGQSLGSGVALRMAAEGHASAVILESPYTSVVDIAAARYPIFPVRWLMRDRFDNLSLAPKLKLPILVMHGTADEIVPFAMGEQLARALPRATFVPVAGGAHNLNQTLVIQFVQRWLRETRGQHPIESRS